MSSIGWRDVVDETVGAALGREHRPDPVLPGTGGPAGNARLTAWTGLVLLVLFVAELVTLLDVHGLIGWHLALGVILIPPALLKTATTGWRIVRYYTGDKAYREAGPPPLLLRVLGPLVVLGSLALLGTGLALVVLGEERSRQSLFTVAGQRVDVLTLHQAVVRRLGGRHRVARPGPAPSRVADRSGWQCRRARTAGADPGARREPRGRRAVRRPGAGPPRGLEPRQPLPGARPRAGPARCAGCTRLRRPTTAAAGSTVVRSVRAPRPGRPRPARRSGRARPGPARAPPTAARGRPRGSPSRPDRPASSGSRWPPPRRT